MSYSVTRQESNALAFQSTEDKLVRRTSERSLDFDLIDVREFRHLIEAAAANDAYLRCGHLESLFKIWRAVARLLSVFSKRDHLNGTVNNYRQLLSILDY